MLNKSKKMPIALFAIGLLVFLSACTANVDNNTSEQASTANPGLNLNRPERAAELSGVIRAVNGNEITIAIVERPGISEEADSEVQDDKSAENSSANLATALSGTGGAMPGGGRGTDRGGGQGPGADMDESERLDRLLSMSKEDVIVVIPVGTAMITGGSSSTEAEEATFSDLEAGKNINVWLDGSISDRKVAEFVSLR